MPTPPIPCPHYALYFLCGLRWFGLPSSNNMRGCGSARTSSRRAGFKTIVVADSRLLRKSGRLFVDVHSFIRQPMVCLHPCQVFFYAATESSIVRQIHFNCKMSTAVWLWNLLLLQFIMVSVKLTLDILNMNENIITSITSKHIWDHWSSAQ